MSRHYVPSLNTTDTVIVGYDRPLDEFFAQIFRAGNVIENFETSDYPTALEHKLAPFAVISDDVLATLVNERLNRATHPMMLVVDHRKPKA